jgi:hypothetical protein
MLGLLGVLVFVYHFGVGIYYARGLEPLPEFEFLYTVGFLCGVVWWLQAEARRPAVKPVYCLLCSVVSSTLSVFARACSIPA